MSEAAAKANISNRSETELLKQLEKKTLWLSTWIVHHANNIREKRDPLKVGGHQASCASAATIMTALYFSVLTARDKVAVKPHASPVLHAIHYLMGDQSREKLEKFRALGGAQSYPSRLKDAPLVDFSTGSVGLGAAFTNFASLTADYLQAKGFLDADAAPGRMIAIVGDAELDEGNVYEALLDTWKHDLRNIWWVIDYNRQSLDGIVNDELFRIIGRFFRAVGWNVVTIKYGAQLRQAFAEPGGAGLKRWLNKTPNDVYSALVFARDGGLRRQMLADTPDDKAFHAFVAAKNDEELNALAADLGGHCMETLIDAFNSIDNDRPTAFIAYTVKGLGLPLQGHKDNHAGLLNVAQMEQLRREHDIAPGEEWERFAGLDGGEEALSAIIAQARLRQDPQRIKTPAPIATPKRLAYQEAKSSSTQEVFGRILNELSKETSEFASRIVTISPDVTVSTGLSGWVNNRGLYHRNERKDAFRQRKAPSMQKWDRSRAGQHIELGIAENNLFLALGALGLSGSVFGERLFPIGSVYDPFISRGLDALNYACYQDARFILAGTPAGVTLAPEGGAHQSIYTPLIGMGQPGLAYFEPAYADELEAVLCWAFDYMQQEDGSAVYVRLTTRQIDQPKRSLDKRRCDEIARGAYWAAAPTPKTKNVIAYAGAIAPEAYEALHALRERGDDAALLAVTSPDRLHAEWFNSAGKRTSHIETLLGQVAPDAKLVTVLDGSPAALGWIGTTGRFQTRTLGVTAFGVSGDIPDLYRQNKIDCAAILDAFASMEANGAQGSV